MSRAQPWKVRDALWERVEPLIPVRPPHSKEGDQPPMTGRCLPPSSLSCALAFSAVISVPTTPALIRRLHQLPPLLVSCVSHFLAYKQ
jgi:hypothetical protein